jgi:hypothetical protein
MIDLPEIIDQLQRKNLNTVSMQTKINYQQVWRIKAGIDKNPTYRTMKALSDYLRKGNEK